MRGVNGAPWTALERRSPTLFLSAGVLLVGYATLNGTVAVTGMSPVAVEDVVGPAGFLLGFIGLLGLYPGLADRQPILARAGAVCVGLGAVGFSVVSIHGLAVVAGFESATPPGILLLLVALGMIPGYLSFGVVSLRATVPLRPVAPLLLVPALVFVAMLSQPFVYAHLGLFTETTMEWSNFAISTGQAVAHLAIGYELRTMTSPDGLDAPSTDVTVS